MVEQVQALRTTLQLEVNTIYRTANKRVQEQITPILDEMYLDDEDATQKQRLVYADKNGNRNKVVGILVASTLLTNQRAMNRINVTLGKVYNVSHGYVAKKVYNKMGVNIPKKSFDLSRYTKKSVRRNASESHAEQKYLKVINRMLKNGDGTRKISKQIQQEFARNKNSANAITLTETTRIQSKGRLDVIKQAERKGMKFKKIWRHGVYVKDPRGWHVDMDGETVDTDKAFSNGLMYPGDPNGEAREIINCHCFLDEELISW